MNFIRSLYCVNKIYDTDNLFNHGLCAVPNCVLKENVRSRSYMSRGRYSSYWNAIRIYQYICMVHVVGIGAILYEIVAEGRVFRLPVWKEAPNQGGSAPAVPGGSAPDLLHTTGRNNFPLIRSYMVISYVICIRISVQTFSRWICTSILALLCDS